MRSAWLPVGLVLLGAVGAPLACGEAFQSTESTTSSGGGSAPTTGMGGAGGDGVSSSDSSSTMTTSSTGVVDCMTAKDCTGTSSLCGEVTCVAGACGIKILQPDGKSLSQVYGDCHVIECAKGQLVDKMDSKDIDDDGNECTTNTCKDGAPMSSINTGIKCANTNRCTAAGACVECLSDEDCSGTKPMCSGTKCVPFTCTNGIKDLNESDKDCGGIACAPCEDDLLCEKASNCLSGVCSIKSGESVKACHHDCNDGVKNGNETGADCGGPMCSTRCPAGEGCVAPTDCASGVCKQGFCQAPTCTDGVKNGAEADIDCGASGCTIKNCPG